MTKQKTLTTLAYVLSTLLIICVGALVFMFAWQPKTAENIYEKSLRTVVELKAFDNDEMVSYGSAVCINGDGTFITNAHVVSYKVLTVDTLFQNIQIRFASAEDYVAATLEKIDYEKDLATIKVDPSTSKVKPVKMRTSRLKEGETVYAIGNAQNYGISIMDGIISQSELTVEVNGKSILAIQCGIDITDGNSGGALLDADGKLIGITTFRLRDKGGNTIYGTSFALPISTIKTFLAS